MREGKEKEVKENRNFMSANEENLTEISDAKRDKCWSSNTQSIKEANSLDNMGVTSRPEPIVNY